MKQLLLIFSVAATLSWIALVRTDGFTPSLIKAPLIAASAPSLSSDLQEILSQPFHYLGKGRQCFVFASEDGKFVLKFFNQKYLKMPWYAALPFFHEKEKRKRERRNHFYRESYPIALREFGEGILYLHLGSAREQLPMVCAVDRVGQPWTFDLNQLPFVLQKKGVLFYPALRAIYEREGRGALCREIDSFVQAIASRIEKQIGDADQDVEHNWGYVEGELVHIDPGRLYLNKALSDPNERRDEWGSATHAFRKWLEALDPETALYLDEKISSSL